MIEIIPNWHPIFVHFTVALFSLAVGLFVITPFLKPPLQEHWTIVARWSLWFGAGFTVITVLTGLYAYNTVAHDSASHAAMTDHRNWAVGTAALFLVLSIWSFVHVKRRQAHGIVFAVAMVVAGGLLGATAWHGGEAVYRFGLGVMSLPKSEGDGHAHEHADGGGHAHGGGGEAKAGGAPHDDGDGHAHDDMNMDDMSMDDVTMDEAATDHGDGHDHEH